MTNYAARKAPVDVTEHLDLVERIARKLLRRLPSSVPAEELVSAGVVGLLEAASTYSAGRGTDFRRFASTRVRGAMLDELRRRDLLSRDARALSKQIDSKIETLTRALGRLPEEAELAEALGIGLDELRDHQERTLPVQSLSLEDAIGLASTDGSDDRLEARDRQEILVGAMAKLKPRQQQVLALYFHEEFTLRQIGQVFDLTESRVSQILSETLSRLRVSLRAGGIEGVEDV